ncbi:MarR family winged helix-turn-helix transcriptional regulator [Tabrizicola sp.]|uniref:MarR family winged helix-turn-helix transcriptional regulator n=1 Tax=Tabrizicola sp. TaxID=2005166 RepID=UPI002FDD8A3D
MTMAEGGDFDLQDFLPYLLNQAAEATSRGFQATYRTRYGLTRTQWRVMANLGRFGAMTARDICRLSHIEKTKVSRAVAGLEAEGLLTRSTSPDDRRAENLSLTPKGRAVFTEIGQHAQDFDAALRARLGPEIAARIDTILREIIALNAAGNQDEDG